MRRQRPAHAAELVVVLAGLERDVVAEPLRLLVGVGVAADVDEQRGVVDDRRCSSSSPMRSASRSAIRHWRRTCSIGCPKPEVDAERQRRHEFGQPHPWAAGTLHLHRVTAIGTPA